jgi:hypothetical protein
MAQTKSQITDVPMSSECSTFIERELFNTDKDYKRKCVIDLSRKIMFSYPNVHAKVLGSIEKALDYLISKSIGPLIKIKFNGNTFIAEEQFDTDLGI